jgi:hypothetical protein
MPEHQQLPLRCLVGEHVDRVPGPQPRIDLQTGTTMARYSGRGTQVLLGLAEHQFVDAATSGGARTRTPHVRR